MLERMQFEFDWLSRDTGNEIDRSFYAAIGLLVGDQYATRLEDLSAKTVRNHMRGCAWHLATWFAANWWRLRWEPMPAKWTDIEWRLAHSMASVGGGYVWPNVSFASDGDYVEVQARTSFKPALYEPIRYLNEIVSTVTAEEFEQRIDEFIESVLSRHDALHVQDKRLPDLWAEVRAERQDPELRDLRKLEALAGYDPDEAPEELLRQFIENRDQLGKFAFEEVVAEARHATIDSLRPILELASERGEPRHGGYRVTIPDLDAQIGAEALGGFPWQKGTRLAKFARERWGLGGGPLNNEKLAGLLGAPREMLAGESIGPTNMPIGLRTKTDGGYDIYFSKRFSTSRRFVVSRLIGDHLYYANNERLRPATRTKTSRQKFQRAFAQELLCPFDTLMEKLDTHEPDEEDITEAAQYFDVAPLMVRTILVNKGVLERESLSI